MICEEIGLPLEKFLSIALQGMMEVREKLGL